MKFGILFRPQDPPNAEGIVQRWQEILTAARVAEESGFDGLFVPEHHMMPDGYPPSPWAALGALAAITERVDIGTTIHLLPFEHPVHVAEHGAMVDILSNGRLRLGVGLGNFPSEFELFGLDARRQVSRFEEGIEIVQRAWAGEELDFHGKHFDVKGRITPKPVSPELWVGAMSEPGVRRAARFGAPWPTDPLHNIEVMRYWTELYRAAGEEYGTSDKLAVNLLRDAWVGDSLEEVERVWWPHVRADHWFYFEKVPRWVAEREPFLEGVTKEEDFTFDRHRRDRLIVGSPDDCIASVRAFQEAIDPAYLIMTFRMANGPGHEEELACIRRFGREVIPAFRTTEG
ncbi:LLM class flavin-dependent oxidoreductase [Streptomyces sp. TS71-3]|uniref:LLM class flavin-dependent oxidoreductase n=1 Tax=Streptomyces sp. TS71-3 TaxID=2733862 RepID=UPI001B22C319|nr:LLM class flavin-dependent oxidoreductase [Streptomyces sp. TS71-3]GHJ37300.1 luciferase [Streptomyces sp. TS71-3]